MRVIHPLKMDLVGPWGGDLLHMVQGDSNTRIVELHLFSNGIPWEPLKVSSVVVAFKKPDQTKGFYKASYTLEQNKVQVVLAPQVLTAPGKVTVAVVLLDGEEDSLASFPFGIMVAQNPEVDAEASEDYFDYINPLVKKALEETLKAAETAANGAAESATQAAASAKIAEEKAALADQALALADQADKKVDTLREVVSKFHSNIQEIGSGEVITVSDASDLPLAGLKVFGKTTQNGTPTPDAPIPLESVGDVTVTICGKNLFATAMPVSVGADGAETATDSARSTPYIPVKPGMKMAFSKSAALTASNANGMLRCFDENKEIVQSISVLSYNALSGVRTIPEGVAYVRFCQFGFTGVEGLKIQIEYGDAATDYDDTEAKTLPISTDYGLPGIWDGTGNQWIRDEVDFERGVYVQRVDKHTFDGTGANWMVAYNNTNNVSAQYIGLSDKIRKVSNKIKANALCSSYVVDTGGNIYNHIRDNTFCVNVEGNLRFYRSSVMTTTVDVAAFAASMAGVEVIYELAEEKNIPLTPEELAAYAELHTNYPNSTIFNDSGADMEVKYVADTKLYIDKKFNELAAAVVSKM